MKLKYAESVYQESLSQYYLEYTRDTSKNAHLYLELYEMGHSNYEGYMEKLSLQREGKGLPEGWAPSHTLFLIDNEEIKGVIRIRMNLASAYLEKFIGHIGYDIKPSERGKGYGHEILKQGLIKAKALGLTEVLLLCSEENPASRKIIEQNGGVYETTITDPDGDRLRRYWINLVSK